MRLFFPFVLLALACGAEAPADDLACTPGEQRACACPGGGPPGAQVCADAGDRFGMCFGCGAAATTGLTTGAAAETTGAADPSTTAATADATADADTTTTGVGDTGPAPGEPSGPPQSVYPDPPPDAYAVVEQVAGEHPDWLVNSCLEMGGDNQFLFEVVRRLRQLDDRWGLNWKRGVVGDMSQDVVDYHYGEGLSEESTDVYIIDMIGGHCPEDGSSPQAAWIDVTQATIDAGTVGMWTLAGQDL
jgi:hypothetical protein